MSRRLHTSTAAFGAIVLALAGCGGSTAAPKPAAVTSTVPVLAATTTTAAPATTVTSTTTTVAVPSTTGAPTTAAPITAAPTTAAPTTIALPVPQLAPTDPNGPEAKVQIGSIEIPSLGVSKPMFEGVSLTTLNRGPGHWPGTALPGELGNVVVGGHRVSHDKPFRNIDKLVPGDDVLFETAEGRFDYKVVSSEVVLPTAIHIIDQTPEHTATLFACTPPGSTSHRLVVHLVLST